MSSRRSFITNSAKIALGAGMASFLPMDILAALRKPVSANDKIGLGVIGCNGQGWNNLKAFLKMSEVECVALCDVDQNVLNRRKAEFSELNMKPVLYADYRRMLDDKSVDIVVVATPDHWHCLQMIDACAAGKDVFCEKPVGNSIAEIQLMNKAVGRYGRMVQVAQWQRSMKHFQDAIAFVHSGKLGKISSTKAWMHRPNTLPLPVVPNSITPQGVDYKMWLGPAKDRDFNKNRFHYEFRWFWDYAGGLMTDWGVHLLDMILLGMKAGMPRSVLATGGKFVFPDDARETPDIQTVLYEFDDFQMSWEHNLATGQGLYDMQHGIAFIGENGTLLLSRKGWEVRSNGDKMKDIPFIKASDVGLINHAANFVDVVKSRKSENLNCPFSEGAKVAVVSQFGNLAYLTGEKLNWDVSKNKFDSRAANKLIAPDYHNGWKLPSV